jgi:hypothetical protein
MFMYSLGAVIYTAWFKSIFGVAILLLLIARLSVRVDFIEPLRPWSRLVR